MKQIQGLAYEVKTFFSAPLSFHYSAVLLLIKLWRYSFKISIHFKIKL